MVRYTKYGKHRYQIFIFNDYGNLQSHIYENVGNTNVMHMYMKLGIKFFPDISIYKRIFFNNERFVLNRQGFLQIYEDGTRNYISSNQSGVVKMVYIDMMQLDNIPEEILNKIKFKAVNRDLVLDNLLE